MQCKHCEYRLWNLPSRTCPECGQPFAPSQFEFLPNSVQFICPHCGQDYYGTSPEGHLEPLEFDCVRCGQHIHMDEMVLLPTAGLREEDTQVMVHPWLERRRRGSVKAFFKTIGLAMVSPIRLMQSLPAQPRVAPALWFCIVANILIPIVYVLPFVIIPLALMRSGGQGSAQAIPILGITLGIMALVMFGFIFVWMLLTHFIVLISGRKRGGLAYTLEALAYSAGANTITAIPCIGPYFGWIWWYVSATLMLKERQQITGLRAAIAVFFIPLATMIIFAIALTTDLMNW